VLPVARYAEDLDPHKKVKDLLQRTEQLRDDLDTMIKDPTLYVGDFYQEFPKTAEARKVMDSVVKKIKEAQLTAFRALGTLRKLDKAKE
jgi:hypothetical protein